MEKKLSKATPELTGMPVNNEYQGVRMSKDDFLRLVDRSDSKFEFINGFVYGMGTPSANHNRLTGNIFRKLGNHLQGKPCEAFASDMMVNVADDYFCPDVLVVCDHERKEGITSNPIIVVQVLSPSTRSRDETEKLLKYINVPSLQEYVMVEQDVVSVKLLRKSKDWRIELYTFGASFTLESIGLTLTVEEIYDRVDNDDINEYRRQHS